MIPIKRLEEPRILSAKKAEWTQTFLAERAAKPGKRPPSSQYAHKEILAVLQAMSFHKCFYCEQSTKQTKPEVDHYIEVAESPERAFEWENLYCSCPECNDKIPNTTIAACDCLDPCDPDVRPAEHLTFDDELIRAREASPRGMATIRKYKLDRAELDLKRVRQLRYFDRALDEIRKRMITEGRRVMTEDEKGILRSLRQQDRPFSLMFAVYIERVDL
jgi:hypothetical protein